MKTLSHAVAHSRRALEDLGPGGQSERVKAMDLTEAMEERGRIAAKKARAEVSCRLARSPEERRLFLVQMAGFDAVLALLKDRIRVLKKREYNLNGNAQWCRAIKEVVGEEAFLRVQSRARELIHQERQK